MTRVGLDVGQDRVRAVIVRGSKILWNGSTPVALRERLPDAVDRVLSSMPLSRRARRVTRVSAAFGPSLVQTKPLAGIPELPHRRLVARLVRENTAPFFLRARGPIVLGAIERRDDGTTWAAGFDQDALLQVAEGVRRSQMRFERAVPAVSAVGSVVPNDSFVWSEGGSHVQVTTKSGTIERIRRLSVFTDSECRPPALPHALAGLGEDAWSYAAAYGAAGSAKRGAFAWYPEPDPQRARLVRTARNAVAALILVCATAAAILAPGIRAARFVHRGSLELDQLREIQRETARAESEVRRVGALIDHIARFRSARGGITLLLGGLAATLPESTAMVGLRVDSLEGSFVALTPRAAEIVPQLLRFDRIAAPRIIGSVTTEAMNATHLERATFRFRRPRQSPPSPNRRLPPTSPTTVNRPTGFQ